MPRYRIALIAAAVVAFGLAPVVDAQQVPTPPEIVQAMVPCMNRKVGPAVTLSGDEQLAFLDHERVHILAVRRVAAEQVPALVQASSGDILVMDDPNHPLEVSVFLVQPYVRYTIAEWRAIVLACLFESYPVH